MPLGQLSGEVERHLDVHVRSTEGRSEHRRWSRVKATAVDEKGLRGCGEGAEAKERFQGTATQDRQRRGGGGGCWAPEAVGVGGEARAKRRSRRDTEEDGGQGGPDAVTPWSGGTAREGRAQGLYSLFAAVHLMSAAGVGGRTRPGDGFVRASGRSWRWS